MTTDEQAAVLQTMTEVLRGFITMLTALHPQQTGDVATILKSFAQAPRHDLRPESRAILLHLAEYPEMLASALSPAADDQQQKH